MHRHRILMTASTFPRWDGDTEPEFILQLAAALGGEFQVTVLAPHCRGARREEVLAGVHIVRYRYAPERWENLAYEGGMLHKLQSNKLRWLLVPCFLLRQLLAVRALHRRHKFDLLHAHWIVPQGLVVALLRILGIFRGPVILTSHGGDLYSLSSPLFKLLKRAALRFVNRVNVVSSSMVGPCEDLGVESERIFVRSMGVDLETRFVASTPFEDRSGLVFVGRLVEKKGVDVLLRALAHLVEEQAGQYLTIVGDGPLADTLRQLATELGCGDHITFTGPVPNTVIPEILNRARVAVVPSIVAADGDQEGLGLVAVEAMGCACAVVASDLPALRDVITDGESGLMVEPGNIDDLAWALRRLDEDPELAGRLAAAGHRQAAKFSWSTAAQDYTRHYRELIEAPTGSSID